MSDKAIILFFPLFSQLQDGMGGKKLEQGQVLSLKRKKNTSGTVLDIF
jgi:hypothetical protein